MAQVGPLRKHLSPGCAWLLRLGSRWCSVGLLIWLLSAACTFYSRKPFAVLSRVEMKISAKMFPCKYIENSTNFAKLKIFSFSFVLSYVSFISFSLILIVQFVSFISFSLILIVQFAIVNIFENFLKSNREFGPRLKSFWFLVGWYGPVSRLLHHYGGLLLHAHNYRIQVRRWIFLLDVQKYYIGTRTS